MGVERGWIAIFILILENDGSVQARLAARTLNLSNFPANDLEPCLDRSPCMVLMRKIWGRYYNA
jgi:hypothetical protein